MFGRHRYWNQHRTWYIGLNVYGGPLWVQTWALPKACNSWAKPSLCHSQTKFGELQSQNMLTMNTPNFHAARGCGGTLALILLLITNRNICCSFDYSQSQSVLQFLTFLSSTNSFHYTLSGYTGICLYIHLYVHSLVRVQTASPLYRLHFLTDCHETSHTCSQTSSLVRVRVSTFCSQKRGQNRIWQIFWRHKVTDFISYPIVTKRYTCVHKHHLLYEFSFWPSAVKN